MTFRKRRILWIQLISPTIIFGLAAAIFRQPWFITAVIAFIPLLVADCFRIWIDASGTLRWRVPSHLYFGNYRPSYHCKEIAELSHNGHTLKLVTTAGEFDELPKYFAPILTSNVLHLLFETAQYHNPEMKTSTVTKAAKS